jgi:hypothetical protein
MKWELATIPPLVGHVMAYDSNRGITVVFGGSSLAVEHGETWEYDGNTWKLRATEGPPARAGAGMAYDLHRSVSVLFGGYDSVTKTLYGDTWEWDGQSWKQVALDGPSPRLEPAMAFDAARGVVLLFGGSELPENDGETWTWDGEVWKRVSETGPAPRTKTSIAYDTAREVAVLFGRNSDYGIARDTWEWDGSEWYERSESGPSARSGHSITYDPDTRRTILFGGFGYDGNRQVYFDDTWEWDGDTWVLSDGNSPTSRAGHALVYDAQRSRVVLFGGASNERVGDTWERAGGDWSPVLPAGPRFSPHPATYDSKRGVLVAFDERALETWEWHDDRWSLRASDGPAERADCALAYDGQRGVTVLFGGYVPGQHDADLGDTWEWDGNTWAQVSESGPPARSGHAMVFNGASGRVLMFGGRSFKLNSWLGDTWDWDGSTWAQLNSSGPAPRVWTALAYDVERQAVVLFGGVGQDDFADT